jgi:hypothetical protein
MSLTSDLCTIAFDPEKAKLIGNALDLKVALSAFAFDSWTPTFAGFSSLAGVPSNPSGTHRYLKIGKFGVVIVDHSAPGTSNSTGFTMTLPFTPKVNAQITCIAIDNSAVQAAPGQVVVTSDNATLVLYKTIGGGSWTDSGTKGAKFILLLEVAA